jgi:hypoxanthine phosphoribosyltransferase
VTAGAHQVFDDVLIEPAALQRRIAELGEQISRDYAGSDLLLIGVLKGAVFFMADLARHISIPCELDFMAVSSYGAATKSSGTVRMLKDLDASIEGRDVLIVEDIIDSGLTLTYLLENLRSRKPRSIEVCALLVKPERAEVHIDCRYTGFEIPNKFVVGYGLDYAERFRNLDYIACLDESNLPELEPVGAGAATVR